MATLILTCLSSGSANLKKNGQLRMTYTISNGTFEITEFEGRTNGTRVFAEAINSIDVEINGVNKTISLEKYVDFNTSWTAWGVTDTSWGGLTGSSVSITIAVSNNHAILGTTVFTGHVVRNEGKVITMESLAALHEYNKKAYIATTPEALNAVLADGATILSPYQYGDELPEAGIAGRIFFKRLYNSRYDINADGVIDEMDANMVLEHANKTTLITDENTLKRADVNEDGEVDVKDAQQILQYVGSQA